MVAKKTDKTTTFTDEANKEVYEFEMLDRKDIDLGDFGKKDGKDSDIMSNLSERMNTNQTNRKQLFYETGCIPFDLAMTNGRGLPIGSSILFYANPGTGKTTLFADVLYRILTKHKQAGVPYKALYIDIEGSTELLVQMGLKQFMDDGSLMYLTGPINFVQLDKIYTSIIFNKDAFKGVNLVVIDSINSVSSKATQTNEPGKAQFGNDAKARSEFYKKYMAVCNYVGVTNLFVAQVRTQQGAGLYEDDKKPAVSQFDIHYVDIVAKLDSIDSESECKEVEKREIKSTTGEVVKMANKYILTIETARRASNKLLKNRFGRLPKSKCLVEYGKRVSNIYTVRSMIEGLGLAIKSRPGYDKINDDLLDYVGRNDLSGIDVKRSGKKNESDYNMGRFCRENQIKIVEYLKNKGLFKLVVEQDLDDDYDI